MAETNSLSQAQNSQKKIQIKLPNHVHEYKDISTGILLYPHFEQHCINRLSWQKMDSILPFLFF